MGATSTQEERVPARDPAERSTISSIAALERHAKGDPVAATAKARATWLDSFEDQVDPNRELDPEERARRAARLRSAHMKRLALKSARARRRDGAA